MNMTKYICTLIMLCSTFALAESGEMDRLNKDRKIYEDTIAKYNTNYRGATQAWSIEYIKKLKALQTKFQAAGNLDSWEVANKELKRYSDNPSLSGVKSSLTAIRKLQNYYRNHAEKLKLERDTKNEDLRKQYVARLISLQKTCTQKGAFEVAVATRDEINRVGGSQAIKESEREHPKASSANSASKPSSPTTKPTVLADGTEILPPGAHAPNKSDLYFKDKSLSSTEHSPWPSSVYVKFWESSEKDSDSFERDHFIGNVDGKVKSDARYVRTSLRMSKSGAVSKDLQLQIEYYAKPASGSGDPRLADKKIIPIEFLDSRTVYVDAAPVSIDSLSRSVSFGRSREHTKTVGESFYGYIVTVLDSKGSPLYQGATSGILAKLATVPGLQEDRVAPNRLEQNERPDFAPRFNGRQMAPRRIRNR